MAAGESLRVIVCGILTDGRDDLLAQTVASAKEHLAGQIDHLFVVHDGIGPRKGLAGAVQTLWGHALATDADYLFHLEDDFTFNGPVDLAAMVGIIEREGLAQLVLQRQALVGPEFEAGGVAGHAHWVQRDGWVEQSDLFSLNPCLIPRRVLYVGWPSGPLGVGNESGMTARLAGERFGFLGEKHQDPHVTHIGVQRSAGWQL